MNHLEVFCQQLESELNGIIEKKYVKKKDYGRGFLEAKRDLGIAHMKLLRKDSDAHEYCKLLLARAKRYDVTEVVIEISDELMLSSSYRGDNSSYKQYFSIREKYREIQSLELKARDCMGLLILKLNSTNEHNPDLGKDIKNSILYLSEKVSEVNSFKLPFCYYYIKVLISHINNNYDEVLSLSNEAIDILQKKYYSPTKTSLFIFSFQAIPILIQRKKYVEAVEQLSYCKNLVENHSYNFYLLKMYEILILLHMGSYRRAKTILRKIDFHRIDNPFLLQRIQILKAYVHLMLKGESRFKVNKFLNEVRDFEGDKYGHNVAIIIIQLLHLTKEKKYGKIIDKLDAISHYIYRYLRKEKMKRSEFLFKIFMLLPKSNFHLERFRLKTEKLYEKMTLIPMDLAKQGAEFEVIPYEKIYNFILSCLDAKPHFRKRCK